MLEARQLRTPSRIQLSKCDDSDYPGLTRADCARLAWAYFSARENEMFSNQNAEVQLTAPMPKHFVEEAYSSIVSARELAVRAQSGQ